MGIPLLVTDLGPYNQEYEASSITISSGACSARHDRLYLRSWHCRIEGMACTASTCIFTSVTARGKFLHLTSWRRCQSYVKHA